MASKVQRWIDLLASLLRRSYAVPFDTIAAEVPGYGEPGESRRRMFERDKDELRKFGVPIQTCDLGDNTIGYSLSRKDFYLPYLAILEEGRERPLESKVDRYGYHSLPILAFLPDELRVIQDVTERLPALRVPSILENARSALRKLGAAGLPSSIMSDMSTRSDIDADQLGLVFDRLNDALARRKRVTFEYHSPGGGSNGARTVEPYGLFFIGHHWYLAAVGPDHGVVKNFRLSRMDQVSLNAESPATPDYLVPATFNLREHARSRQAWELGATEIIEAQITILRLTGASRAVARLGEAVPGFPERRSFKIRRVDTFARWLLGFAGMVSPLGPPELVMRYQELVQGTLSLYRDKLP